jgi:cobalt/nickel transport system permease protein
VDISIVDRSATSGDSLLHGVAPRTKLIATALLLGAVIASTNVLVVLAVALVLWSAVIALGLTARPLAVLALYPGVFAALYAFALNAGYLTAALIISKAVTAALVVLIMLFTTPYPQVFAPIQRVLPEVIADALLMTYRSLFLLLDKFSHTLTAARLRAGIVGSSPVRSAATVTRTLGGVLLYSIDLSQRTHDIMHLRGYDGRLIVTPTPSRAPATDRLVITVSLLLASVALAWRVWWPQLNPYAWVPVVVGVALCAVALISRTVKGSRS